MVGCRDVDLLHSCWAGSGALLHKAGKPISEIVEKATTSMWFGSASLAVIAYGIKAENVGDGVFETDFSVLQHNSIHFMHSAVFSQF